MNELLDLCKEIRADLQELKRALVKLVQFPPTSLKKEWIRSDQVIQILGISNRTFSRLTKSQALPFTKVGGILYIKTSDVEQLLNKNYKPK